MKSIFTIILIAANIYCLAQDERDIPNDYMPSNLFVGGSVSLNLGGYNNTFLAGLNPHFGYTLAKWADVAAVTNFQYSSARDQFGSKYRNTTYGLGVFTRIYPVPFIFIQAQPEYNFTKLKYIPFAGDTEKDNLRAPSLLIGAGYTSSRADKNTFTYLSILVDVLNDINSPYIDGYGKVIPVIRAGVNIGLRKKQSRQPVSE